MLCGYTATFFCIIALRVKMLSCSFGHHEKVVEKSAYHDMEDTSRLRIYPSSSENPQNQCFGI